MNLVVIQNRQAVTTSLQVAESFEKEVKHVNEVIRKLTVENSAVKKNSLKKVPIGTIVVVNIQCTT